MCDLKQLFNLDYLNKISHFALYGISILKSEHYRKF
jgi:hypothetical protein